jgi:hypothetical protein
VLGGVRTLAIIYSPMEKKMVEQFLSPTEALAPEPKADAEATLQPLS